MVDDGSTDGTPEVLARFAGRITVDSSEGRGVSAARNRGIALAQGELLVFLDADDLLPPHYLARFVEAAAAAPRAEVFHCGWRGIDFDDGRVLYGQDLPFDLDWDPFHALAAAGSPPISALAVRRRTATRVGPFDETESLQADWDYWLRLAASGATFQGVPGNVAIIRRRNDSMSASAGTQLAVAGLAVLERHLSRHQRCPACISLGRGSPELATGCAPLVGPRLRAPASPRGPHGTAGRRGRRGRVSAASRVHSVAGATRETTHRLRIACSASASAGAAVWRCGGGGKVAESLSSVGPAARRRNGQRQESMGAHEAHIRRRCRRHPQECRWARGSRPSAADSGDLHKPPGQG